MLVDVTADDVANGWRPLTAEEQVVAAAKIRDALVILSIEAPGLDGRIASGEISTAIVRVVVVQMVSRYLKNPDGDRTITDTESIDDYTKSSTRIKDTTLSSGDMFVTARELAWLGVTAPGPRAFGITLGGS